MIAMPSKADTPHYQKLCRRLDTVDELLSEACHLQADGKCKPIDWLNIRRALDAASELAYDAGSDQAENYARSGE